MNKLLPLSALLALGCNPVRYQRIEVPELPPAEDMLQNAEDTDSKSEDAVQNSGDPQEKIENRVVLIMVAGLQSETFSRYLKMLEEDDYTPAWQSGLAFLGAQNFRLAQAKQAEAPIPATTLSGIATVLTGQYASKHQFPSARFYTQAKNQPMLAYDFESPAQASQLFYAQGLKMPQKEDRILGDRLIAEPLLYERLAPQKKAVSLMTPFARKTTNYVPSRKRSATASTMPVGNGFALIPEMDSIARMAAINALTAVNPEDLFVLNFLGTQSSGCFQEEAVCTGQVGQLEELQLASLQKVDGELWRVLKTYATNHPKEFKKTTFILLSPAALTGRAKGEQADKKHQMTTDELLEQLIAQSSEGCDLKEAKDQGLLAIALQGSSAQFYLRQMPYGQQAMQNKRLACLASAAEKLALNESNISGAAWKVQHEDLSYTYEVALEPNFQKSLNPSQRQRLLDKMKLAANPSMGSEKPNAGADVLLFAQAPWMFVEQKQAELPYAAQGNLELSTTSVPFLVASRFISQATEVALRTLPIELTDVVPTILSILNAPKEAYKGLDRAPILAWYNENTLEVVNAPHQIYKQEKINGSRFLWSEKEDRLFIGFEESTEEWPPDELSFRLGDNIFRYDGNEEKFDSEDCKLETVDGRRRWICSLQMNVQEPIATWAIARRSPDMEEGQSVYFEKMALGKSEPNFLQPPTLACATHELAKIQLNAEDLLGFDRIDLFLTDKIEKSLDQISMGGFTFSLPLNESEPSDACKNFELGCVLENNIKTLQGIYSLPFPAELLTHMHKMQSVNDGVQSKSAQLQKEVHSLNLSGQAPKDAILGVRLCSLSGSCKWMPLASDTDYEQILNNGCP